MVQRVETYGRSHATKYQTTAVGIHPEIMVEN